MKTNFCIIFFLALFTTSPSSTCAEEPTPFYLSCDDITRGAAWTSISTETPVIIGEIRLNKKGGARLYAHQKEWFGSDFAIIANNQVVGIKDSTVGSYPPCITFEDKTWPLLKQRLMAICPKKTEEMPDHIGVKGIYKFWENKSERLPFSAYEKYVSERRYIPKK